MAKSNQSTSKTAKGAAKTEKPRFQKILKKRNQTPKGEAIAG